jgi:hypothetical protein
MTQKQMGIFGSLLIMSFLIPMAVFADEDEDENGMSRAEKARKIKQIERKIKRVEPTVKEVQKAALRQQGMDRETIDSYRTRASVKALAPELGVEFDRDTLDSDIDRFDFSVFPDRRIGLERIDGQVDNITVSGRWNLPNLIYNPEVLETVSVEQHREELLKEVTRNFYLRRRLKIGFLLNPPTDPKQRMALRLRIKEITSTLNGLTDGIFRGQSVELQ